jgi:hypothetical protein
MLGLIYHSQVHRQKAARLQAISHLASFFPCAYAAVGGTAGRRCFSDREMNP